MEPVLKLLLDLYHDASDQPLDEFQDFALATMLAARDGERPAATRGRQA